MFYFQQKYKNINSHIADKSQNSLFTHSFHILKKSFQFNYIPFVCLACFQKSLIFCYFNTKKIMSEMNKTTFILIFNVLPKLKSFSVRRLLILLILGREKIQGKSLLIF